MISVIIPAKNAAVVLPACLKSINRQLGLRRDEYEVIVVDDGSSDGTARVAAELGAWVISQPNAGPAAARNRGARAAHGHLLVFTDADCIPADNWLAALTAPFTDAEVVGVKGVYRTRELGLIPRFVQCEYAQKYLRMGRLERIDFIDTYSAAYRCGTFLENGGFDESFPVPSVEDQEFSFRLARKGYRLVFQPAAAVYHRHDLNVGEYIRRKLGIGYWKAFMLRWLPEKAFSDSHTPASQRLQLGLLGLALLLAVLAFFWPTAGWAALACLAAFFLSGLPFLALVWDQDPPVAWIVLPMLLVRALALGAGLAVGFIFSPMRAVRKGMTLLERVLKRSVDVLVSLVGLIITSPLLLGAALAIRLDSPGPVFFMQLRAGENGRPFRMIKLRTMVVNAEQSLDEVLALSPLQGNAFKIPNDPRVTRVGRFLRRWSLDELPQLINVLLGQMSLVGPRPEEMRVVAQYSDAERQRLAVRPGLTGPMQVAGRGELDMAQRLVLELDYIDHCSLCRDMDILLRTLPAVIKGKGAF